MNWKPGLLVLFTVVVLSGCATMPSGPTVTVMPNPGKPFEVFMADDGACREWAQYQIGGTSPSQTANENLAAGAVVGTVVGAGLGALVGAATGNAGAGAAIGAGAGLLGGTSIGGNAAAVSGYELQRRYDIAYQQCMYAKGNQIPGAVRRPARAYTPPPPPPPPSYSGGSWVTVPGQYVNGKWVPEHRVQVPSSSERADPGPQAARFTARPLRAEIPLKIRARGRHQRFFPGLFVGGVLGWGLWSSYYYPPPLPPDYYYPPFHLTLLLMVLDFNYIHSKFGGSP